jgi:hypothetical protein
MLVYGWSWRRLMDQAPAARTDDLVITRAGEDLIIYDSAVHQLHQLNSVAATVFDACDGTITIEELGDATHLDSGIIGHVLQLLSEANLLASPIAASLTQRHPSRRALFRKAGVAAATVISVSAPAAVAAQSVACFPLRTECTPGGPNPCCAPGLCDTWAGTAMTVCCLPNGMETGSTAHCCSGTSSFEEIGSDVRICVARAG